MKNCRFKKKKILLMRIEHQQYEVFQSKFLLVCFQFQEQHSSLLQSSWLSSIILIFSQRKTRMHQRNQEMFPAKCSLQFVDQAKYPKRGSIYWRDDIRLWSLTLVWHWLPHYRHRFPIIQSFPTEWDSFPVINNDWSKRNHRMYVRRLPMEAFHDSEELLPHSVGSTH